MLGVISLLTALALSLLVARVASVALAATGLGWEAARFQARSAFTGVGFTTSEAEEILAHPTRRRIVMWLMLAGHLGLATVVTSLVLGFGDVQMQEGLPRVGWVVGGVVMLAWLANNRWVDRRLSEVVGLCLERFTGIGAPDYGRLLHVCSGDFAISEIRILRGSRLAGRTLAEAGLKQKGILVLGIERSNRRFLGTPTGDDILHPGDTIIVYGNRSRMVELRGIESGGGGDAGDGS